MTAPSGVYRGEVARTTAAKVWVRVPRLGGVQVYGPCEQLLSPGIPTAATGVEGVDTEGAERLGADAPAYEMHAHVVHLRPLQPGDRVLVAFLEGRGDDIVVLGRLP